MESQAVPFLQVGFQRVTTHGLAGLGTAQPQDVAARRHRAEIVIKAEHAMNLRVPLAVSSAHGSTWSDD